MAKSKTGMGFVGWLQLTLIIFKLTNAITWSWWWVWSPFLLITACTVLLVLAIAFIPDQKNG